jgi:uncharacterized membrane protein
MSINLPLPKWIRFLIIILIVLGFFFRFANIDEKLYWKDEAYTSFRVSGYTKIELIQEFNNTNIISVKDLQKYQRPSPTKSAIDTIRGLVLEEPQLTPLYFVMSRFWAECFGSSVTVMRSLSILISLLILPAVYWLCIELFKSPQVGWVAIALMAVSPFQVLYAQEARPYGLWALMTLISSASLLRAMRFNARFSWSIYAITLALSFYAYLFSFFIAIWHLIYVTAIERFRLNKTLVFHLLALIIALIAFAPWLYVLMNNLSAASETTSWAIFQRSTSTYLMKFFDNLSGIFSNCNEIISLAILIMEGYPIYYICCMSPKRIWMFILLLVSITLLPLMFSDLILGGRLSIITRYLIPCYLGFCLSVSYLFANQITFIPKLFWRRLWQIAIILLISTEIWACVKYSSQLVYLNGGDRFYSVAHTVNQSTNPLLIVDGSTSSINPNESIASILTLSHLLDSKVGVQLVPESYALPKIPDSFNNVFLFKPTRPFLDAFEKNTNYKIVKVIEDFLWKLEKS